MQFLFTYKYNPNFEFKMLSTGRLAFQAAFFFALMPCFGIFNLSYAESTSLSTTKAVPRPLGYGNPFELNLDIPKEYSLFIKNNALKAGEYPSARLNRHLQLETSGQTQRLIPSNDWFTAAVDGDLYVRTLGNKDFYHGTGYWLQTRTEVRPHDYFSLNMRTIMYSGSVSFGYSAPSDLYNLFSFWGRYPMDSNHYSLEIRAIDLGRQTLGNGLILEEKETSGMAIYFKAKRFTATVMRNGTGGLLLNDDITSLELTAFNALVGLGSAHWTEGISGQDGKVRDPYHYLFSRWPLHPSTKLLLEAGTRENVWAGLIALENFFDKGRFEVYSKIQYRHYDEQFAKNFAQQIQQMYVSYDQYDKDFTQPTNIFVWDDNARVYALKLNLMYHFSDRLKVFASQEVGRFEYRDTIDQGFHFYKGGVKFYPLVSRNEHINIFVSNKVLVDSFSAPPEFSSSLNAPLFKEFNFAGAEARFYF